MDFVNLFAGINAFQWLRSNWKLISFSPSETSSKIISGIQASLNHFTSNRSSWVTVTFSPSPGVIHVAKTIPFNSSCHCKANQVWHCCQFLIVRNTLSANMKHDNRIYDHFRSAWFRLAGWLNLVHTKRFVQHHLKPDLPLHIIQRCTLCITSNTIQNIFILQKQ